MFTHRRGEACASECRVRKSRTRAKSTAPRANDACSGNSAGLRRMGPPSPSRSPVQWQWLFFLHASHWSSTVSLHAIGGSSCKTTRGLAHHVRSHAPWPWPTPWLSKQMAMGDGSEPRASARALARALAQASWGLCAPSRLSTACRGHADSGRPSCVVNFQEQSLEAISRIIILIISQIIRRAERGKPMSNQT